MPPRSNKSRRQTTITYNLSSASARDAFEEELDLEDEERQQRAAPGQARRCGRGSAAFSLSADLPTPLHERDFADMHEYATPKATTDMINLLELFGSASLDRDVIESVYLGSSSNFELAMERLMELAAADGLDAGPPAAAAGGTAGATADAAGAAGGFRSGTSGVDVRDTVQASSADATTSGSEKLDAAEAAAAAPPAVCYWELLPEDLKRQVFSFLNSRDLARVARTCRDFAGPARSVRTNTRQLQIPPGLGMHGIMAMVAGHPNARAVSLRQWAHSPLSDGDFTALVVALSAGSRSERRALPVEALSFKGCRWLSDGHVLALCHTMQHLKEVDLTDCVGITDAALLALAKYQRLAPEGDASSSDDDDVVGAALPAAVAPASAASASGSAPQLPPRRPSTSLSQKEPYDEGLEYDNDDGEGDGDDGDKADVDAGVEDDGEEELQFECDVASSSAMTAAPLSRRAGAADAGPAVRHARSPSAAAVSAVGDACEGDDVLAAGSNSSSDLSDDEDDSEDGSGALAGAFGAGLKLSAAGPGGSGVCHGTGTAVPVDRSGGAAAVSGGLGVPLTPPPRAGALPPGGSVASGHGRRHGGGGVNSTASTPLYGSSPAGGSAGLVGTSCGAAGSYSAARGAASPWLYGTSPSAAAVVGTPSASVGSGPRSWLYGSSPVMGPSPFFRTSGSSSITHNGWLAKAASTATHHHSGRGLLSINLSGCTAISSDGVRALLSAALPKACLLQLDISRCPRITRAALALPATSNLCVLRAAGCHNLHEVILQLPLTSPLTELHLSDCKAMTKLHVVAPALQQLHVGSCRHLTRLYLRCPQLRHLTASLCFRLTDLDPERWDVGRLEHLNLFGCRHLEWPGLSALLGRCGTSLRHLDINGCNAIVVADIPAGTDALQHLDASGCKSLLALRCGSSALATATLRSCPRLQELALESPALSRLDISNCPHLQRLSLSALQQMQRQLQEQEGLQPPPAPVALRAGGGGGNAGEQVGALRAAVSSAAVGGAAAAAAAGPAGTAAGGAGGGGIMIRMAGCDRLPVEVAVLMRRLREAAKRAAAASAAAQREAAARGTAA